MLYGVVLGIHLLVCLVLIGVILLQGGRGGLSEALGGAAAQSLFGGSAATVMTRVTTICAGVFVVTCLSLAYLSTIRGRSVMERLQTLTPENLPIASPTIPESAPAPTSESPKTPPAKSPQGAPPASPVTPKPSESTAKP